MTGITYDMRRADWLAGDTWMSAPAFPNWSAIDLIIIHWPGGNGVPVSGDPNRVNQFVRNQQANSVRTRGYNLGYSTSVDWLGRRIEIRGDINRNAANAPAALNARSVSIQVITNLDGAMTDAQVAGVRDLVGQFQARAPRAQIIGHRDGPRFEAGATATQCPGDVIYARIGRGDFNPSNPTPTPPPEDDDMTPDQAAQLQAVHDALLVQNPVTTDPGMSIAHQATQTHTIMRTFWDGFPGNIVDGPGRLARTIKNIAAKVGAASE